MSIRRPCSLCLLAACLLLHAANKTRLPEKYAHWLEQEAVYIITDEERKAFLQLSGDSERERFIEEFWNVRNPARGRKPNAFKEEHYQRIQYANQNFGRRSNTPGWQTDMGRTWILFGKPESKVSFTGYGQIYPLELWFYENKTGNPSLPPFFQVLFFIPEDIGEYRFYHPVIDGPMKLVRGTRFRSNRDVYRFLQPLGGDIAHAAFSLVPNDPIDTQNFNVNMSGEMLISKIQNFANDPFNVKRIRELRSERASVISYILMNEADALDLNSITLCDTQGQCWLDYAIWIKDQKLGRSDASGQNLIVSTGFRLTTESGERIVDDSEERAYPAFENAAGTKTFLPFRVANRVPLVPGKYVLHAQVINRQSGRIYEGQRKITLAAAHDPALSVPLLISAVQQAPRPDALTPFQYYGVQFIPAVERRLSQGEPLRVLFQIQVPSDRGGDYSMEYVIANAQIREQRQTLEETIPSSEFQNGKFLKAKTMPLAAAAAGDYRMVLNLRAKGASEVLASSNIPFRIGEEPGNNRLYFLSNFRASAKPGVAAYVRALESLAQQDREKASEFLTQAIDQNPANTFAGQMLVGLYFNSRKYARVTALYEKVGIGAFRSAPETLAQISVSFWEAGNAAQARQVLETARSLFPGNPLLETAEKNIRRNPSR